MAKLWILSDLHLETLPYPDNFRPEPPPFDVLVAASDIWEGDPGHGFTVLRRLAGSTSRGRQGGSTSTSGTSRAKRQSRIVLPSEIQSLPDLHGFLKPAGPWPVVRVRAELPQL